MIDPPLLCLLFQEVKEVLDSQWGLVFTDTQNGLEQVIQKLLQRALHGRRWPSSAQDHTEAGKQAPLAVQGSPWCWD